MVATTANVRVVATWDGKDVQRGTKQLDNDLNRTNSTLKRMAPLLRAVGAAFSAAAGAAMAMQVVKIADAWKGYENRIKLFTSSARETAAVSKMLFDISQRTRVSMESTTALYQKFSIANKSLKLSQQELAGVIETVNQALIISGGSSDSANAAVVQLGQGLASGVLRGEELNSVLEQAPRLAMAIANGMGVAIGALRELGAEGKITAVQVIDALQSQAGVVASEYGQIEATVESAWKVMTDAIGLYITEFDKAIGMTEKLAAAMLLIAKGLHAPPEEIVPGSQLLVNPQDQGAVDWMAGQGFAWDSGPKGGGRRYGGQSGFARFGQALEIGSKEEGWAAGFKDWEDKRMGRGAQGVGPDQFSGAPMWADTEKGNVQIIREALELQAAKGESASLDALRAAFLASYDAVEEAKVAKEKQRLADLDAANLAAATKAWDDFIKEARGMGPMPAREETFEQRAARGLTIGGGLSGSGITVKGFGPEGIQGARFGAERPEAGFVLPRGREGGFMGGFQGAPQQRGIDWAKGTAIDQPQAPFIPTEGITTKLSELRGSTGELTEQLALLERQEMASTKTTREGIVVAQKFEVKRALVNDTGTTALAIMEDTHVAELKKFDIDLRIKAALKRETVSARAAEKDRTKAIAEQREELADQKRLYSALSGVIGQFNSQLGAMASAVGNFATGGTKAQLATDLLSVAVNHFAAGAQKAADSLQRTINTVAQAEAAARPIGEALTKQLDPEAHKASLERVTEGIQEWFDQKTIIPQKDDRQGPPQRHDIAKSVAEMMRFAGLVEMNWGADPAEWGSDVAPALDQMGTNAQQLQTDLLNLGMTWQEAIVSVLSVEDAFSSMNNAARDLANTMDRSVAITYDAREMALRRDAQRAFAQTGADPIEQAKVIAALGKQIKALASEEAAALRALRAAPPTGAPADGTAAPAPPPGSGGAPAVTLPAVEIPAVDVPASDIINIVPSSWGQFGVGEWGDLIEQGEGLTKLPMKKWHWAIEFEASTWGQFRVGGWTDIIEQGEGLDKLPTKQWAWAINFDASPWSEFGVGGWTNIIEQGEDLDKLPAKSWNWAIEFKKAGWSKFGVNGYGDIIDAGDVGYTGLAKLPSTSWSDVFKFTPITLAGWTKVINTENLGPGNRIVRDWWQAVHLRHKYGMGGEGEGARSFVGWKDVIAVEKLAPGNRIVRDWWEAVHLDNKYGMGGDVEGARSFTGWHDVIAVEKLESKINRSWSDVFKFNDPASIAQFGVTHWNQLVTLGGTSSQDRARGYGPQQIPVFASQVIRLQASRVHSWASVVDVTSATRVDVPLSDVIRFTGKLSLGDILDLGEIEDLVEVALSRITRNRREGDSPVTSPARERGGAF